MDKLAIPTLIVLGQLIATVTKKSDFCQALWIGKDSYLERKVGLSVTETQNGRQKKNAEYCLGEMSYAFIAL